MNVTKPFFVTLNGVKHLADVMPRLFRKARIFGCGLRMTLFCQAVLVLLKLFS
jgi:hypothetical protein